MGCFHRFRYTHELLTKPYLGQECKSVGVSVLGFSSRCLYNTVCIPSIQTGNPDVNTVRSNIS